MVKSRKRDHSATMKTGQFVKTANRYTPLAEVHADNVGTIPVVVNGYISTKRTAKVNNRNTSCRTNGGIVETKQLNLFCHVLSLLGHHILHVSGVRVKRQSENYQ